MEHEAIFTKKEISDLMRRQKKKKMETERDYESIEDKNRRKQLEKESFEKREMRRKLRMQEPIEQTHDDYDEDERDR